MTEGRRSEGWVGMPPMTVLLTPDQAVLLPPETVPAEVVFFCVEEVGTALLEVICAEVVVLEACEMVDWTEVVGGAVVEVAATRPRTVKAAAQAARSMFLGQHHVCFLSS